MKEFFKNFIIEEFKSPNLYYNCLIFYSLVSIWTIFISLCLVFSHFFFKIIFFITSILIYSYFLIKLTTKVLRDYYVRNHYNNSNDIC